MEYEETKNEGTKPWQNSAWMKRKGSGVGSSTVHLDMPDVTKPSHHKGLREFLEAEHAAKKTNPNFFPDSSFLGNSCGFTSLCGVYEWPFPGFVSLCLPAGNLCECSITDRIIKSQKLGISMAQIHGYKLPLFIFFYKGFFLKIYINFTCWGVCLAS